MSNHKIRSQIILATGLSHSNKLRKIQKKIGQVEVDLGVSQIWGLLWLCWGPNGPIWSGSKAVLGTTHVVEQLLFSMFLSILFFSFDSILGSFWTFWGPNGFLGQGGFKNCVGVSSCRLRTFVF